MPAYKHRTFLNTASTSLLSPSTFKWKIKMMWEQCTRSHPKRQRGNMQKTNEMKTSQGEKSGAYVPNLIKRLIMRSKFWHMLGLCFISATPTIAEYTMWNIHWTWWLQISDGDGDGDGWYTSYSSLCKMSVTFQYDSEIWFFISFSAFYSCSSFASFHSFFLLLFFFSFWVLEIEINFDEQMLILIKISTSVATIHLEILSNENTMDLFLFHHCTDK